MLTSVDPRPELWGKLPAVDLPAIEPLKWTSLDALLDARNEKVIGEKIRREAEWRLREAWLSQLGYAKDVAVRAEQLTIAFDRAHPEPEVTRFAIIGDPGEGDVSQWAVVRPFLALHRRDRPYEFAFVLSDVIYPAGATTDYPQRFYGPYHAFDRPVYAVPGNHDWDDGSLTGFMTHFARHADGARVDEAGDAVLGVLRTIRRMSWWRWRGVKPPTRAQQRVRHALAARDTRDAKVREAEPRPGFPLGQPGPYFRIRVGPLWLVCIDTGMTGTIDEEQAEWLLHVSRAPGPKILLTGKPLYVDGRARPGRIAWRTESSSPRPSCVADIVADDGHAYVATIGGDVHNYQRYQVSGRDHLVAGGSGAFLASTDFAEDGAGELDHQAIALYPSAGLSRVHFEAVVGDRLVGSRLMPGIAAGFAVLLAAIFMLGRWAKLEDGWIPLAPLAAVSAAGAFALWRLRAVGFRTLAALAVLLAAPVVAAFLVRYPKDHVDHIREYFGGYGSALGLFVLTSVSITRKLTAPAGKTIREHRPFATLGLAAAAWLLLMIVLSSWGSLTTFGSMNWFQVVFVCVTAIGVLAAGVLSHFTFGHHLWRLGLLWLVLIGGSSWLLFGLEWNEAEADRQAFRYGLAEGITVLLAAMGVVAGLLGVYARTRLLPNREPEQLRDSAAAAVGDGASVSPRKRHELMAAILRLAGRRDWLGPIFEAREPPLLKSFLDVEVHRDFVKVTAYRASGFEAEADDPEPVDAFAIELPAG